METARDRRTRRARRELAAAAIRLFEEQGFAETTVEEIAASADYSASTFFRQFGTKEDAVFHDIAERMHLYDELLKPGLTVRELWKRARALLVENATYWQESDPDIALARTRLMHREPALYRRFLAYCDDVEQLLARAFTQAGGEEADIAAGVVGAAAVGAWRAGFTRWLAKGGLLTDHIGQGLDHVDVLVRRLA